MFPVFVFVDVFGSVLLKDVDIDGEDDPVDERAVELGNVPEAVALVKSLPPFVEAIVVVVGKLPVLIDFEVSDAAEEPGDGAP